MICRNWPNFVIRKKTLSSINRISRSYSNTLLLMEHCTHNEAVENLAHLLYIEAMVWCQRELKEVRVFTWSNTILYNNKIIVCHIFVHFTTVSRLRMRISESLHLCWVMYLDSRSSKQIYVRKFHRRSHVSIDWIKSDNIEKWNLLKLRINMRKWIL